MADPAEGEVPKTIAGNARQTLAQLKTMWGVQEQDWSDVPPLLIYVNVMGDYTETWKKIQPAGEQPKKAGATVYELIERKKVGT